MNRQTRTSFEKPIKAIATTDEDVGKNLFIQFPDGRTFKEEAVVLPQQQVERIRQGYMCVMCFEPLSVPFPRNCPLCAFPCAEQQTPVFAKLYAGIEVPPPSWEEKLAALDEDDARRRNG